MKIDIASKFLGWCLPVLVPIVHITFLWYFGAKYHFPVDKSSCTCECWDSIFKGPYECGIGSYKNFYFNATINTLKIWIIIATGVIILYECTKYLIKLLLKHKLRFSMFILYISSIFPHYYSWWVYINYYNDGFYVQWYHQLFFTVTEMLSTSFILYLCNIHHEMTQKKLLAIIGISIIHIIASGIDQFVINIFLMQGYPHQVIRDFGFMIPDILQIAIPALELYDIRFYELTDKSWYNDSFFIKDLFITFLFVVFGCFTVSQTINNLSIKNKDNFYQTHILLYPLLNPERNI